MLTARGAGAEAKEQADDDEGATAAEAGRKSVLAKWCVRARAGIVIVVEGRGEACGWYSAKKPGCVISITVAVGGSWFVIDCARPYVLRLYEDGVDREIERVDNTSMRSSSTRTGPDSGRGIFLGGENAVGCPLSLTI